MYTVYLCGIILQSKDRLVYTVAYQAMTYSGKPSNDMTVLLMQLFA